MRSQPSKASPIGATTILTPGDPEGSRFSDGTYGVYYAANVLETAIAEVSYHRAKFLARTAEPEIDVDLRWIQADLRQKAHDISAVSMGTADLAAIYDPDQYGSSQVFGRALRELGCASLAYDSVRHAGGQCVAVFVPRALTKARSAGHLSLHWDGHRISHWFEKGEPRALDPTASR